MNYVKHFGQQIPVDVANIAALSLFNFHGDEFKQKAVMLARAVSDRGGLVDQLYEKTKALEAAEQEVQGLRASVSHFSGLLGKETEKRYALEEENKRLRDYVTRRGFCFCGDFALCEKCEVLGRERP